MTTNNEENTPLAAPTKPSRSSTPSFMSKTFPFLITIVISIASTVLYTNLYLTKQTDQLITEIQQLKKKQLLQSKQDQDTLTTMKQSIDNRVTAVNDALNSALQERWYQRNDWILLKVRYYLELAVINAHWSHDLNTTLALLKTADTLLASIQNEQLMTIRQALAKEETALQQITPIDTTGILSQLDAIQHAVNKLTPKKPINSITNQQTDSTDHLTPLTWRDNLKASLNKLNTLVIIRHQDDAMLPLSTPTYIALLRENIRLNLQETQWAVLQQNQMIFQLTLNQAIENIKRAFDITDPESKNIIVQLQTLETTKLEQAKPDLKPALQLLNELIVSKTSNIAGEQP